MRHRSIVIPLIMALFAVPAASYADAPDAVATAAVERKPVVIIRFNRNHVYFEKALRQAVEATEKAKAGASYEVVSMVPSGKTPSQNDRMADGADARLQDVLQEMSNLGVPGGRISASTQAATGDVQEIQIFVK